MDAAVERLVAMPADEMAKMRKKYSDPEAIFAAHGLPAEGTSIHKMASTFIDSPLDLAGPHFRRSSPLFAASSLLRHAATCRSDRRHPAAYRGRS